MEVLESQKVGDLSCGLNDWTAGLLCLVGSKSQDLYNKSCHFLGSFHSPGRQLDFPVIVNGHIRTEQGPTVCFELICILRTPTPRPAQA